jgi:medium-chain acyl-[acyl-carrier-protein] hydrolase
VLLPVARGTLREKSRMSESCQSNDWIVIQKPAASPRARLLCFPHGGGSPTTFNAWREKLPDDIEVCALQLPGRGRRLLEAPPTSIGQIIETLLRASQPFQEIPIALFGHSLGAWMAFEFARQLQPNAILLHLFVSGQSAPQLSDPEAQVRNLPDREFISEVHRRYDGLPEELLRDDEMMKLFLPALRADFRIKETYQYIDGPSLNCPISCLGGREDHTVSVDDLAAWRDRARGTFRVKMFPGGHFFIDSARESVLKFVATELECSLRERDL